MSDSRDTPLTQGRRLASIFDGIPADTPLSLDELEILMHEDTERRIIAVLDRVFGLKHEQQPP